MAVIGVVANLTLGGRFAAADGGTVEAAPRDLGAWYGAGLQDYGRAMNALSSYREPPFIPIGLSLGVRDGHFMFGTEVSLAFRVVNGFLAGAYVDGLYGAGRYCFSVGPEAALGPLVLDGGYMGCATAGPTRIHVGVATVMGTLLRSLLCAWLALSSGVVLAAQGDSAPGTSWTLIRSPPPPAPTPPPPPLPALGRTFFVPVGLNVGGAMGPYGRFHVGGELSAVWTRTAFSSEKPLGLFWGLYADGLYVLNKGGRFTVGPELGWSILGVDGGYELITDGGTYRHGAALRAFVHIPNLYVTAYSRGHHVSEGNPFFDFGVLLKLPLGYAPRRGW